MKLKKIFITVQLLFSITVLFGQKTQEELLIDTLNFTYEGSLFQYEKIIERVVPSLYEIKIKENGYRKSDFFNDIINYPLIKSFSKRISSNVDMILNNSEFVHIKKDKEKDITIYNILGCYILYYDYIIKASDKIADSYIELLIKSCGIPLHPPFKEERFSVVKDMEKKEFSKKLDLALKQGIKSTATSNGFYNEKLAIKIAKGCLFNELFSFLYNWNTSKDYIYKVIYSTDRYLAIGKLSNEDKKIEQRKMLKKVMKMHNSKKNPL